ncbi:hypothetical protein C0J52_10790 [Blattella germanica]|nr:hypothetical protein C0J52_10790 [Blattella germanica]
MLCLYNITYLFTMQVPGKRSVVHSEGKQIIYNVIKFCDEKKKSGVDIPRPQANARGAKAVGKSEKQ